MNKLELDTIRMLLEAKSTLLWKHEDRAFAKMGLDESKFHEFEFNNRTFFVVSTNVFYQLLNAVLSEACEKYPECFGTDKVEDVLNAIYKIEAFGSFDQFSGFLKEEQFAWVVEIANGQVNQNVLRIELFRKINTLPEDGSKSEFTGGVFHSFKHFNFKGIPLSTKRENKDIEHPSSIIDFIIHGFFFSELKLKEKNKYESKLIFKNDIKLCCVFYHESNSKIYFLNSVIPN